jgi:DNA-binding transcriptional regulator YiaG
VEKGQQVARVRKLVRSGQVRSIRMAAGLSQVEVAELLGVTPSAVCRWEAGARMPHGDVAIRYLELLMALAAS